MSHFPFASKIVLLGVILWFLLDILSVNVEDHFTLAQLYSALSIVLFN